MAYKGDHEKFRQVKCQQRKPDNMFIIEFGYDDELPHSRAVMSKAAMIAVCADCPNFQAGHCEKSQDDKIRQLVQYVNAHLME